MALAQRVHLALERHPAPLERIFDGCEEYVAVQRLGRPGAAAAGASQPHRQCHRGDGVGQRAAHPPRPLRCAHDAETVVVAVIDTGAGIGTPDLERIFNPLFTTKPDGMGMGLSICRSIVEGHQGRLWATPNEGRGMTFAFSLPAR
jgi:hypothetical protein